MQIFGKFFILKSEYLFHFVWSVSRKKDWTVTWSSSAGTCDNLADLSLQTWPLWWFFFSDITSNVLCPNSFVACINLNVDMKEKIKSVFLLPLCPSVLVRWTWLKKRELIWPVRRWKRRKAARPWEGICVCAAASLICFLLPACRRIFLGCEREPFFFFHQALF